MLCNTYVKYIVTRYRHDIRTYIYLTEQLKDADASAITIKTIINYCYYHINYCSYLNNAVLTAE